MSIARELSIVMWMACALVLGAPESATAARSCCTESDSLMPLPDIELYSGTYAYGASADRLPYFLTTGQSGQFIQPMGIAERVGARRALTPARRFAWGAGAEGIAEYTKSTPTDVYDAATGSFTQMRRRPGAVRLQQLWGAVKWRSLWLELGMRQYERSIMDDELGVGDIVMSRNARPIPQLRFGFMNFVDVPFTRGVLQLQGEIAYGKFADNGWLRSHYNYYNSFITTGAWMHYKRLYLRLRPERHFLLTIGMQHAAQFGGTRRIYEQGREAYVDHAPVRFRDFLDVFVQRRGGSGSFDGDRAYYNGNHLGAWDVRASYRFDNGARLTLLAQLPWEDGSGIGKLNGWDGRWGVRMDMSPGLPLEVLQLEYVDFTNQSGPMHWAPGDFPGTGVGGQATGADDYYNNTFYDGWANYGMAIGTPFVGQPALNTDGYLRFTDTRVRGFQIGAAGRLGRHLDWEMKVAWRSSLGTPFLPRSKRAESTSACARIAWRMPHMPLRLTGALAFDSGSLNAAGVGAMVGLEYSLNIPCSK